MRARLLTTSLGACALFAASIVAAAPDHPVITEVYTDPPGDFDGPLGRDPSNLHQEYIEIHLPALADLAPGFDKDSLDLTLYDVEGDASSSQLGLVNYRIDLPTFDLDPSNGLTGLPRPASGVVVLGWVDYDADPPTDLAGTPSTRIALIDGGVTATTDFTFIAINGNEFGGTTNFPTPAAISHIDAAERATGLFENGSSAFLLVSRDDPGYVQLPDAGDPCCGPPFPNPAANPDLAGGSVLGRSSLLDAVAANDDPLFDPALQSYPSPSGEDIDLESVLPDGGIFSDFVPQLEELEQGYARRWVDLEKTTEDAIVGNEDPAFDSLTSYRTSAVAGPLVPTPGRAAFLGDGAELSLGLDDLYVYRVLAGTTGRPGVVVGDLGGDAGMRVELFPGIPTDPSLVTVGAGAKVATAVGQTLSYPRIEATIGNGAVDGAATKVDIAVQGRKFDPADPAVTNPIDVLTATIEVLNPTTGLDVLGQPYQATAFVAVQGLPAPSAGTNELVSSGLGAFASGFLGGGVQDTLGNGSILLDAATDLGDPLLVDALVEGIPDDPLAFINAPGAPGTPDLVTRILISAEWQSGAPTYADSINAAFTAVKAVALDIPETRTSGGAFLPPERVHFADPVGRVGAIDSGLTDATSQRGFELAIVDSNVLFGGGLESGASDDFGLVVEVGSVRPGAGVAPGELIFLSLAGGLEGADVDTLDVPPFGSRTTLIYLDLDALDSELGARTIRRLYVIDGSGSSELNVLEVFSLNVEGASVPALPWAGRVVCCALLAGAGLWRRRRGHLA